MWGAYAVIQTRVEVSNAGGGGGDGEKIGPAGFLTMIGTWVLQVREGS